MELIKEKSMVEDSKSALEDVYRLIVDLAQRQSDKGAYYKKSLNLIIKPFSCPYASLYVQMPSGVIEEYQHKGSTSPNFWKSTVRSFMHDALAQKRPALKMYGSRKKEGTNALFVCPPDLIDFEYGIGSFEKHSKGALDAGARLEVCDLASLELDLDEPEDLALIEAELRINK